MKARLLLFLISACFLFKSYGQDASVIQKLYRGVKIIPSKNVSSFNYRYDFDQKSRVITITCTKHIDKDYLKYVVKVKDFKHIFKKTNFSLGDGYQYLDSYFIINGLKASLRNRSPVNENTDILAQISDVWSAYDNKTKIKRITLRNRNIYLIQGTDPFCNGHGCTDFIVYILQKHYNTVSINSVYFGGKSTPRDFDNLNLFFDKDSNHPELYVPVVRNSIRPTFQMEKYSLTLQELSLMPPVQHHTTYHKLNVQDRKNFILSIDQKRIPRPQDTVIENEKCISMDVPLWLSNYSKDTLKFWGMSCSWYEFYQIKGKNMGIYTGNGCDGNYLTEKVIAPHKSVRWIIPMVLNKNYIHKDKFRIGMNLYMNDRKDLDTPLPINQAFNLIWSNEVEIP